MKIICVENNRSASYENGAGFFSAADGALCPSFYMKPDTALLRNNEAFYIPSFGAEFRCSLEFVVKSNRVAKALKPRFVERCYDEVALAVNFEAADVVAKCQQAGLSCDAARAFDHSTAMSPVFMPVAELGELAEAVYELKIDDAVVLSARVSELNFSVDTVVSYVSDFVTLKIGDLVLMGPVADKIVLKQGMKLEATLNGRVMLNFEIR